MVWLGLLTYLGMFGGGESALPFGVLGGSPALILAVGLIALFFTSSWRGMIAPTGMVLLLACFSILVAVVWRPESASDLGYPSL